MNSFLQAFLASRNPTHLQTPCYLYFHKTLEENIRAFKRFINAGIEVLYAVKANNYPALVREIAQEGFGFDVASKEELHAVLQGGALPEKIIFSAPSKKEEDLRIANTLGVRRYAFDSECELRKIMRCTHKPELFARIAVNNKSAAFNLSSKFGMYEEYFMQMLNVCKENNWKIYGLSFHVGSQNTAPGTWKAALKHTINLLNISEKMGLKIQCINMGGGMPAQYSPSIKTSDYYIDQILTFTTKVQKQFPEIKFIVEPGRSMAANTMALITKVIDVKPYKNPPMLIVDTGVFHGIIEPLEGFEYPVTSNVQIKKRQKYYRIGGISCDGDDIIRKKVLLPDTVTEGSLLAFMYAGAYSFVYENFHLIPYPSILNVEEISSSRLINAAVNAKKQDIFTKLTRPTISRKREGLDQKASVTNV